MDDDGFEFSDGEEDEGAGGYAQAPELVPSAYDSRAASGSYAAAHSGGYTHVSSGAAGSGTRPQQQQPQQQQQRRRVDNQAVARRPPRPAAAVDDDDGFEYSDDEGVSYAGSRRTPGSRTPSRSVGGSYAASTGASSAGGQLHRQQREHVHRHRGDQRVPRLPLSGGGGAQRNGRGARGSHGANHSRPAVVAHVAPDAVVLSPGDIARLRGLAGTGPGGVGAVPGSSGSVFGGSSGWGAASVVTHGSNGSSRPRFGGKGMPVTHPAVAGTTAAVVNGRREVLAACAAASGSGHGHAGSAFVSRRTLRSCMEQAGIRCSDAQVR